MNLLIKLVFESPLTRNAAAAVSCPQIQAWTVVTGALTSDPLLATNEPTTRRVKVSADILA